MVTLGWLLSDCRCDSGRYGGADWDRVGPTAAWEVQRVQVRVAHLRGVRLHESWERVWRAALPRPPVPSVLPAVPRRAAGSPATAGRGEVRPAVSCLETLLASTRLPRRPKYRVHPVLRSGRGSERLSRTSADIYGRIVTATTILLLYQRWDILFHVPLMSDDQKDEVDSN